MNGKRARALRRGVRAEAKRALTSQALADVAIERLRQDKLFPEQDLPFGTGPNHVAPEMVVEMRHATERADEDGSLTWRHILAEEVMEAMAESADLNRAELRKELIQVAAVAVRMVENLDRAPLPVIDTRTMTPRVVVPAGVGA